MRVNKPHEFMRFGAMEVTKPYDLMVQNSLKNTPRPGIDPWGARNEVPEPSGTSSLRVYSPRGTGGVISPYREVSVQRNTATETQTLK